MNTQLNSNTTTIRPGIDYEAFSRYLELVQHAVDTGVPLALSPAAIMAIEDAGGVVDLATGEVTQPQEQPHE